jgi:hypothetical protein
LVESGGVIRVDSRQHGWKCQPKCRVSIPITRSGTDFDSNQARMTIPGNFSSGRSFFLGTVFAATHDWSKRFIASPENDQTGASFPEPTVPQPQGARPVKCQDLARKIQKTCPEQPAVEVARKCLMFLNAVDDPEILANSDVFSEIWRDVELRFKAVTDQHSAMTAELEQLACSDPRKFSPDQIWILVRAIKVQSQVLRLFSGEHTIPSGA